jgi:hypothetical protein
LIRRRILKKIFADILGYEVQEWIMDLEALGIHSYDLDDLAGIIYGIVGFLILTPTLLSADDASGIPMGNLSASGLFRSSPQLLAPK